MFDDAGIGSEQVTIDANDSNTPRGVLACPAYLTRGCARFVAARCLANLVILNQPTESPMATMNVSLPDPMKAWIEEQTRDGTFSNASDYVRHLIRRDQARAKAVAQLQAAIGEAIESGEPRAFDATAFKTRMHRLQGG